VFVEITGRKIDAMVFERLERLFFQNVSRPRENKKPAFSNQLVSKAW